MINDNKDLIRVIIINPGKNPEIQIIENNLETLQKIVGGYATMMNPRLGKTRGLDDVIFLVNEDGARTQEANFVMIDRREPIFGSVIICTDHGEDIGSLTEKQLNEILTNYTW